MVTNFGANWRKLANPFFHSVCWHSATDGKIRLQHDERVNIADDPSASDKMW